MATEAHMFPTSMTSTMANAIIIIDNSKSDSIEDTMVAARQSWESRWRRLPFYLACEVLGTLDEEQMALQCMKMILQDVWE